MKIIFLAFASLILLSCNSESSKNESFTWLVGSWERINTDENETTREIWRKTFNEEYEGLGYTLKNTDTVFKEELALRKEDEKWQLIVTGVNESPTKFQLTSLEENKFTAENSENPFPKKIVYSLEGEQLEAIISADKEEVVFTFRKIE